MNLLDVMPYIWITVIVLSVVVEAISLNLISIWFMPAGIISLILSIINFPVWIQVIVFFILAFLLIVLGKTIFSKFLKLKPVATNVDALIGQQTLVTQEINNIQNTGTVKIGGQIWSAKSFDSNKIYPIGELVTIQAVEGVKLVCK